MAENISTQEKDKVKIIFMGTPAIAVPCLEAVCQKYNVALVVSQPDRPKGRSGKEQASPVKEYAINHNIEVYQPETIKNNIEVFEKFNEIKPDFYVVAAYGKILPQNILDIPKIAPINVHFSLLPKYRGAAPVNWAIINGDEITGVSTMLMDAGMDTGDILLRKETPILDKDALTLSSELANIGADLLIKTIDKFNIITPLKQDNNNATLAPMLKKEDGLIKWIASATEVERQIRALYPWPTAYTYINDKMIKLFSCTPDESIYAGKEGEICEVAKDYFAISCGKGRLIVKEAQIEGKKRMDVASLLLGFHIENGMKVG